MRKGDVGKKNAFFSRPKFGIQSVKLSFTVNLEQQRSENAWEITTVKCRVCVFRATSQHLRFHSCLLSFFSFKFEICSG